MPRCGPAWQGRGRCSVGGQLEAGPGIPGRSVEWRGVNAGVSGWGVRLKYPVSPTASDQSVRQPVSQSVLFPPPD
jgi:hypothetical protein